MPIQAMAATGRRERCVVTTQRDGPRVVLEMRDTGRGIPEAAKAHIFEPFFTTKGEGEGTGLGLSVSYGIVTAHGGTIEVRSTSSAGTTFRVTLPAAERDATRRGRGRRGGLFTAIAARGHQRSLHRRRADAARRRAGVRRDARFHSADSRGRHRGTRDDARRHRVDAIVCDLRMPGMDGPAFHETIAP